MRYQRYQRNYRCVTIEMNLSDAKHVGDPRRDRLQFAPLTYYSSANNLNSTQLIKTKDTVMKTTHILFGKINALQQTK
ncbi:MAG: hypothetical protein SFV81_06630 [Pirellulaceae bacterium]|nr:hypothetical protein [Pirellulaceae bacterium]